MMSTSDALALGWLSVSGGTFLLFAALILSAFVHGGMVVFRRLQIGVPTLFLMLVGLSICWPWALLRVSSFLRGDK